MHPMSYQVLARKYRPSNFKELEGQSHVLQALINALDNDQTKAEQVLEITSDWFVRMLPAQAE